MGVKIHKYFRVSPGYCPFPLCRLMGTSNCWKSSCKPATEVKQNEWVDPTQQGKDSGRGADSIKYHSYELPIWFPAFCTIREANWRLTVLLKTNSRRFLKGADACHVIYHGSQWLKRGLGTHLERFWQKICTGSHRLIYRAHWKTCKTMLTETKKLYLQQLHQLAHRHPNCLKYFNTCWFLNLSFYCLRNTTFFKVFFSFFADKITQICSDLDATCNTNREKKCLLLCQIFLWVSFTLLSWWDAGTYNNSQ